MKKISMALLVVFAFFVNNQVQAQVDPQGKYVNSASARLVKMVDGSNKEGYRLQNNSFSAGGGWLKQGADNWVSLFNMQLTAGTNYRIIGVGDMDAKDVDIQILDSNNKIVASDTLVSPEAIVNYRPTVTGRYTIRLRLYASKGNDPCFCLAIVLAK